MKKNKIESVKEKFLERNIQKSLEHFLMFLR